MDPLADYAWKNRPLVLLTRNKDQPSYRRQLEALQGIDSELDDRDVVVFQVINVGDNPTNLKAVGPDGPLTSDQAQSLLDRFQPDDDFELVLVGKDTTETLRSSEVISGEEILAKIDETPLGKNAAQSE